MKPTTLPTDLCGSFCRSREREDTHTAPKSFLSSCTFLVAADGGKAFRVRWPAIITCFSLLSNFEAKFSLKKK